MLRRVSLGRLISVVLIPTCVSLATFSACVTTSETNRKQLNFVPDGYMNNLGVQAYSEMKQKEKISKDSRLAAEITEVGRKIADASGKNFKWEFTLFESKDVNAFCLPGGKVGVYTGIVPVAKTNAGLAAVLGHEVAHAVLKHSGERASQTLLLSSGLIAVDAVMRDANTKKLVMGALGLGAQFGVMLPYSRKHETEADEVGLTYMAKAGYDPSESVELWKRMGKLGGTPPEILSTHPNPENRARDLQSQLGRVKSFYEGSRKVETKEL